MWCILITYTSIFLLLASPRSATTPSQLNFLCFFKPYSPNLRGPVTSGCGANHHSVAGLPETLSLNKNGFFLSQKPYMVAQPEVGLTPAFHTRLFPGWIACRQPQPLGVHNALILFNPTDSFASILHISGYHSLLMPLSETGKGMEYRCLTGPGVAEHSTNAFSLHCDQLWVPELKTDHYKKPLLQWGLKDTQTHGHRDRNVEPLQLLVIAVS